MGWCDKSASIITTKFPVAYLSPSRYADPNPNFPDLYIIFYVLYILFTILLNIFVNCLAIPNVPSGDLSYIMIIYNDNALLY